VLYSKLVIETTGLSSQTNLVLIPGVGKVSEKELENALKKDPKGNMVIKPKKVVEERPEEKSEVIAGEGAKMKQDKVGTVKKEKENEPVEVGDKKDLEEQMKEGSEILDKFKKNNENLRPKLPEKKPVKEKIPTTKILTTFDPNNPDSRMRELVDNTLRKVAGIYAGDVRVKKIDEDYLAIGEFNIDNPDSPEASKKALQDADTNRDGRVTIDEARALLREVVKKESVK